MTLLPVDAFLRPVEGHDDLVAFTFGFQLEGKALENGETAPVVTELEDGDLLIEGWAANFEGIDRQGENFAEGAFQRGIKAFLDAGGPLCFHHKNDHGIGKVNRLEEVEGKGLWMEARVDKQEPSSPLYHIYNAIRKRTYKGLSVGGFFKRALTEAGKRIMDVDFTEISVTPVPVHPKTGFAVVAGKALENFDVAPIEPNVSETSPELETLNELVRNLEGFTQAVEAKALPKKHDPKDAAFLSDLIKFVGTARTIASVGRDDANDEGVIALADEIETVASKWEAAAHKLAAKVGPLPAPPVY